MLARTPAALLAVLLVAAISASACTTPQGTPVTYRNDTGQSLTVTSDEFFLATLLAGQSKKVYTREDLLPDHLRATNERGDVVYDHTVTWDELKTNGFVVVIK